MKTLRRHRWIVLLLLPLACLVPAACGGSGSGARAMPGGFVDAAGDPSVRAVADFAVGRIAKKLNEPLALKRIVSAERQVVAGLNYRLELDLIKNSRPFRVRAVVWRKLDGTMELTSWNPS